MVQATGFSTQGADSSHWPAGIVNDTDNRVKPIGSLEVHGFWNNCEEILYSRNLGKSKGIELVTIPATLKKIKKPDNK